MGNQKSKKQTLELSDNHSNLKLINYLDGSQKRNIFQSKSRNNDINSNKMILNDINIKNSNKNELFKNLSQKKRKKISDKKTKFEKNLKIINFKITKKFEDISKNYYNEISSRRSNISENSSLLLLNPKKIIIKRSNSLFEKIKKEKFKHQFSLLENKKIKKIQSPKKTSIKEKNFIETIYNLSPSYNLPQLTEKATLKSLKDTFTEDMTSDSTKNSKNRNINEHKVNDINQIQINDISIDKIRGLFIKKPKKFRYMD